MYKIISLNELLVMLEGYNHKELHMHHTWRPNHEQYFATNHTSEDQRALDRQKSFYYYHTQTNGWSDIAQHVTLLPDGRFVTGRDFNINPASITGYNTGAFMVEMIGDFDVGKDQFEGAQKESMLGLAKWFDDKGIYIRFHRENSSKTCPGSSIDKEKFMEEVKNYSGSMSEGGGNVSNKNTESSAKGEIKKGDKVKITGSKYTNGVSIPDWVKKEAHIVSSINKDKTQALLGADGGINSWVYTKDLQLVGATTSAGSGNSSDYKAKLEEAQALAKKICNL